MMASISGSPCRAVRMTDCGDPPTPTQVGSLPDSVLGNTSAFSRGARTVPLQVTGFSSSSLTKRSSFSSNSAS